MRSAETLVSPKTHPAPVRSGPVRLSPVGTSPVGTTPTRLVGWWWAATLAVLGVTALLDLFLTAGGGSPAWPVAFSLYVVVSLIAVWGLRAGGPRLFAAAVPAATLSLGGSIGLETAAVVNVRWAATDFGLTEGTALTLLLVACFRRALGHQRWATAAVALAVVVLPLRLGWSLDVLPILLAALAVAAVASATGSALRVTDASHRTAVTAIRRAEREEMARELHDVVAHHVTGMVVLTQAARALVVAPAFVDRTPSDRTASDRSASDVAVTPAASAAADPRLADALATIERTGAEALTSLRSMVAVLRSADTDWGGDGGEAPREPTANGTDLAEVVRRFRDSGVVIRVDLTVEPAARALPAPVQAAVHRVVQESLTNVSRYARGAEWVRVELARHPGQAVVTVSDSGSRDDESAGPGGAVWGGGFGIIGMRERVGVLGGTLEAGPEPGGGWTVRAQVPV